MMSSGFTPRRKPTISLDPKRMGSFDRIGAVPSSRNTSARLRDYLPPQLWNLLNDTTGGGGKGSRAALVLAGALVLTVMVCFGVFGGGGDGDARHVVVFDAGSTGNRVHVFEFENTRDGTPPRLVDEVFHAEKPGFKEMAKDPHAAAALLDPLVATAMKSVPKRAWKHTPLTLRATAGLRLLPEGPAAATAIMDEVRRKLAKTGFDVPNNHVSILGGSDEGLYGWMAVNYLLGNTAGKTVALADLGGGSAQVAYAVDTAVHATAPDGYIRTIPGSSTDSSAYVHSFNGYGIMAARHRILKRGDATAGGAHGCVHSGHEGAKCERDCYGLESTESYTAVAKASGASFEECLNTALEALNEESKCERTPCSFGGAWHTPRAPNTEFYAMSYIAERAVQSKAAASPVDDATPATVTPRRLAEAGRKICGTHINDVMKRYPGVDPEHHPWLCLDVAYVYALLTDGFGVGADETVTLVDKIRYRGKAVEAAWALGDAIATMEDASGDARGGGGGDGVVREAHLRRR